MARAHRHFIPGQIWHITQRCHQREFLLKFAKDRKRLRSWLLESTRRYGLEVLNYQVLSNHVHLLVYDTGRREIPLSLQLTSGRTAQEYNTRRKRHGAFWQDRYHATAVESGSHLQACISYIDLNVVRAGIVSHPREYPDSSYYELLQAFRKHQITNPCLLKELLGLESTSKLQRERERWLDHALMTGRLTREPCWTESLAIGSKDFVNQIRAELGPAVRYRNPESYGSRWFIREHAGSNSYVLKPQNSDIR